MRVWIFCILSAWMLGACNSNRKFSESLLKATLQQADGNAGELISVLEHYEDDLEKTVKLTPKKRRKLTP